MRLSYNLLTQKPSPKDYHKHGDNVGPPKAFFQYINCKYHGEY